METIPATTYGFPPPAPGYLAGSSGRASATALCEKIRRLILKELSQLVGG